MNLTRQQVRVRYTGDVQGVGFRYTVRKLATPLGVTGGVENLPDGSVQMVAEATPDTLRLLLTQIRASRLGAHIADEQIAWGPAQGLAGFYYR
ncbi:MAG TPA: acylphosphatase [Kiritimatiellia bacterium]|nr:acylphosphatase [Kiritimatiellia bacterium]